MLHTKKHTFTIYPRKVNLYIDFTLYFTMFQPHGHPQWPTLQSRPIQVPINVQASTPNTRKNTSKKKGQHPPAKPHRDPVIFRSRLEPLKRAKLPKTEHHEWMILTNFLKQKYRFLGGESYSGKPRRLTLWHSKSGILDKRCVSQSPRTRNHSPRTAQSRCEV